MCVTLLEKVAPVEVRTLVEYEPYVSMYYFTIEEDQEDASTALFTSFFLEEACSK